MQFLASGRSVTGRVRKNNEDNFSINRDTLARVHGDSALVSKVLSGRTTHLLGVYDGMGGHSDGETASYIMATAAGTYLKRVNNADDIPQTLTDLCLNANEEVCQSADGSRMGTTCALLCLREDEYTVCNVGDSPVFLQRGGVLRQISMDHNHRAAYEKVMGKPADPNRKFKLTQCIGIPKDEMRIEPYTKCDKLFEGDIFLLCSDGITDMLAPGEMQNIVTEQNDPDKIVDALIDRAMAAGGRDNATVVCVKAAAGENREANSVGSKFRRLLGIKR